MMNLIDKLMNSDAKILNPRFETLERLGRIGWALVGAGLVAVVVALLPL